ncbi:MAG: hypothetical protein KGP27_06290 [Hyphomicrobiales bacterium]|nr:hypothetical protein [Hyphomicrobiales bacterium]
MFIGNAFSSSPNFRVTGRLPISEKPIRVTAALLVADGALAAMACKLGGVTAA